MRFPQYVAVAALVLPGNAAIAQFAGALGVGSGVGQLGSAGWTRESRLNPSFRLEYPFLSLRFDGMAAERLGVLSVDDASLSGVLGTPGFGPFRFSTEVQYGRGAWSPTSALSAAVAPSLSMRRGPVGAWLGTSHARNERSRLQAGVWTSLQSVVLTLYGSTRSGSMLSIGTRTVRDSIPNDTTGGWNHFDRTIADTSSRYSLLGASQLNARLDWSHRRMAFSASLSTSRTFRDRRDSATTAERGLVWGSVNASFSLNSRLAIIAGAGTRPQTSKHPGGSRFATFGVRLSPAALLREPLPAPVSPAASSFAVEPIEPGLYRFVLRIPGARTVELSGDFNEWTPTSMTQSAPDVWEVAMPLNAGTHRVNVRVNGDRWSAPPGLPAVRDEFNGTVGILVIR